MAAVVHTSQLLVALCSPRSPSSTTLVNSATGELIDMDGIWTLAYDAEGWAYLEPEDDDDDSKWVSSLLQRILYEGDEGRRYIVDAALGKKTFIADASDDYEALYAHIKMQNAQVVGLKLYLLGHWRDGARLYVQLREVQDRLALGVLAWCV